MNRTRDEAPSLRPRTDLTGRRFGMLTVLEYVYTDSGTAKWKCLCDCGNVVYKTTGHLNAGAVSCGCSRKQDLTGKRFGKLTVLGQAGKGKQGILWTCRCDCGNVCEKPTSQLNFGFAVSCGCSWRQPAVGAGERYGKLVTVRATDERRSGSVVWECLCDCGNTVKVRSTLLASGHTASCGCFRRDIDSQRDFKDILTYVDNTCIEFARNIGKPRVTTSRDTGVRGVVLKKGKYQAQIFFQKHRYYLGRFSNLEDAVRARKRAEARVEEYVNGYISGCLPSLPISFD